VKIHNPTQPCVRALLAEARLRLAGAHQLDNAAAAATAARVLARDGFPRVSPAAIAAGLGAAWLPGRFQVLGQRAGRREHESACGCNVL
jgi:folylpolyglutamate synthase/dihydropteroate synthase